MQIRKLEKKDIPEVVDIISSIMNNEYQSSKEHYNYGDLDKIQQVYGGEREGFFVACDEQGKVVGTIAIKEDDESEALLRRFFVTQQARGKGYGSALINAVIEFCATKKYKKIIFKATSQMEKAHIVLEKNGFKEKDSLDLGLYKIVRLERNIA